MTKRRQQRQQRNRIDCQRNNYANWPRYVVVLVILKYFVLQYKRFVLCVVLPDSFPSQRVIDAYLHPDVLF